MIFFKRKDVNHEKYFHFESLSLHLRNKSLTKLGDHIGMSFEYGWYMIFFHADISVVYRHFLFSRNAVLMSLPPGDKKGERGREKGACGGLRVKAGTLVGTKAGPGGPRCCHVCAARGRRLASLLWREAQASLSLEKPTVQWRQEQALPFHSLCVARPGCAGHGPHPGLPGPDSQLRCKGKPPLLWERGMLASGRCGPSSGLPPPT